MSTMPSTARKSRGRSERFQVFVSNQQSRHKVDKTQLAEAVRAVLRRSSVCTAVVSVAVVDDATIHELNRRYLNHDWATDVLSFVLEERDGHLEGEVITSADTAATAAAEMGWPDAAEQLLYVIHGMLHLVGYDDTSCADAEKMRAAEDTLLHELGHVSPPRARNSASIIHTSHDSLPTGARPE
jgi:probable rRNA maturation factor